MTTVQKLIKYCALAFAAFLIISIFAGAVKAIGIVGRIIDNESGEKTTEVANSSQSFDSVTSLDMEIKGAEVYVKEGDAFKAETNGENIKITQEGNKLVIEEDEYNWFDSNDQYVTIYIPKDMVLDRVDMSTGAGIIEVEKISANVLDMELGAGKVTINQINVYNQSEIEGGAGKIEVKSGELANLTMDIGAGSAEITAKVTGQSKFDVGVGKLDLGVIGSASEYTFEVSKGIGDITVGDVSAADGTIIGTGTNKIKLDGGIGTINVSFQNVI